MKLFLDANIIFTAAYSAEGISRHIFELAEVGYCSLYTSAFALEEARRNLALKAPAKISHLNRLISQLTIVAEPPPDKVQRAQELPLALKDAPIMAAAFACSADILVTGDRRDFGHLFGKNTEGVRVLSPKDALEEVLLCGGA